MASSKSSEAPANRRTERWYEGLSPPRSRGVLPIPDRPYEGPLPLDAKDPEAKFPPIEPLQPPAGAPNVLVICSTTSASPRRARSAVGRDAQRHDRPLAARHCSAGRRGPCSQFHHVIDVAPTVLEAAGLPQPTSVNGVEQQPIEGVSMAYSFDGASEADRHETQYFEMFCNRGIYHQGWTAVTNHSDALGAGSALRRFPGRRLGARRHEYGLEPVARPRRRDAREVPELQKLWIAEARKYNVLPLDDRRIERFNAELAGRPELVNGNTQTLYGGMGRLSENCVLNIKNKSHAVTAEVVVPEAGAKGVIVAQGGAFAGWSLYAKEGKPELLQPVRTAAVQDEGRAAIPAGTHQVRMEFAYDGGGLAKGGTVTLYVDGDKVGEGRVEATMPMVFSADETADVGATSLPGQRRLRRRDQRLHRHGQLGADRPRRGRRRRRPPHHARGAAARRDGAAVANGISIIPSRTLEPEG